MMAHEVRPWSDGELMTGLVLFVLAVVYLLGALVVFLWKHYR